MKKLKIIPNKQTPKANRLVNCKSDGDQMLMERVLRFAKDHGGAVGLSANQLRLGLFRINKRFFVYRHNAQWRIIVNPRIVKKRGDKYYPVEQCLTWPGRYVFPTRQRKIILEFTEPLDRSIKQEAFSGFEAQVIQHEMDHLDGIKEQTELIKKSQR